VFLKRCSAPLLLLFCVAWGPLGLAQTPFYLEPNPLLRAQQFIDAGEAGAAFELLSSLQAARAGARVDLAFAYLAVGEKQPTRREWGEVVRGLPLQTG